MVMLNSRYSAVLLLLGALLYGFAGVRNLSAQEVTPTWVLASGQGLPGLLVPPPAAEPRAGFLLAGRDERTSPTRSTYLVAGGLAGAAIGALVGASFERSYCRNDLYTECSANGMLPGALIGGGIGVLAGLLVFEISFPSRRPG
jgi:hypothetical protein